MKNSKRNERNALAKAEKMASGKPKLSKYEAKRLRQAQGAGQ